jgi:hypothetical protein
MIEFLNRVTCIPDELLETVVVNYVPATQCIYPVSIVLRPICPTSEALQPAHTSNGADTAESVTESGYTTCEEANKLPTLHEVDNGYAPALRLPFGSEGGLAGFIYNSGPATSCVSPAASGRKNSHSDL